MELNSMDNRESIKNSLNEIKFLIIDGTLAAI